MDGILCEILTIFCKDTILVLMNLITHYHSPPHRKRCATSRCGRLTGHTMRMDIGWSSDALGSTLRDMVFNLVPFLYMLKLC